MWSRFLRLSWPARVFWVLAPLLTGIFVVTWWPLRNAEAAPCNPLVCVPVPTLPVPQPSGIPILPSPLPSGRPNPFATATPTARPTADPSPGPTQLPPPGAAPVQGQDVGVAALARAAENGASGLTKQLYSQLQAPNISGDWFKPLYDRMTTIAVYILLLCLLLAVLQFLVHRRFGIVAASWFGWAPGSVGITALAITLTNLALAITDGFSAYMLQGIGADVPGFLLHLAGVLALVAGGAGLLGQLPFVGFVLAGLIVVALLGIIAEFLIRQVVIYVCLLWLPLVAAASVWTPARHWLYRLATLQLTVILAKFAVVVVLALGVAAFAANPTAVGPLGDPNLAAMAMGLVVLVVALLSPFALLRLLPHDFEHAASGLSHRTRGAAWRATRRVRKGIAKRSTERQVTQNGIPVASKAGAAVVPITLVVKGGQVVAARGGRVLRQAHAAGAQPSSQHQPAPGRGGKRSGPSGPPPSAVSGGSRPTTPPPKAPPAPPSTLPPPPPVTKKRTP